MRERLPGAALSVALPMALLALNLRLVISRAYLSAWQRWSPGAAETERYFAGDLWLELAAPSTLFIGQRAPASALRELRHAGEALFTDAELSHLEDVQQLVLRILLFGGLAGLYIVFRWFGVRRDPRRVGGWAQAMARGARWMLGSIVLLGIGIVLAWDMMFTGMHRIFFEAGTWQFSADSHLIQLFPNGFWFETALVLAALFLLQASCIIGLFGRTPA